MSNRAQRRAYERAVAHKMAAKTPKFGRSMMRATVRQVTKKMAKLGLQPMGAAAGGAITRLRTEEA